ncbi:MAG: hypothetical protein ISN29_05880 [Gammaproteobacteria bacterium AqS3]|nr:hypothetical protein [Gammaproteobacteria bacterium AqS3]
MSAAPGGEEFAQAHELIKRLMQRPGSWMGRQSPASIAPLTIEEAYELADAIDSGERSAIADELADLLTHLLYYALLTERDFDLNLTDIARATCEKLLRRHPSLADPETEDPDWEAVKAEERRSRGGQRAPEHNLPGLMLAVRALRRGDASAIECSPEHIASLVRCVESAGDQPGRSAALGDLLLACTALAHNFRLEPDWALRRRIQEGPANRNSDDQIRK